VRGEWRKVDGRVRAALLGGRELRCVCGTALWETAALLDRKRMGLLGGRRVEESCSSSVRYVCSSN
jgi:hypothetical protein